jgi:uncharacterized membrane protein
VQDQAIANCQLLGIDHDSIGILDGRIGGNTPTLMVNDPATVLACGLGFVLIAVIPAGCGMGEHFGTPILFFNKFPAANRSARRNVL